MSQFSSTQQSKGSRGSSQPPASPAAPPAGFSQKILDALLSSCPDPQRQVWSGPLVPPHRVIIVQAGSPSSLDLALVLVQAQGPVLAHAAVTANVLMDVFGTESASESTDFFVKALMQTQSMPVEVSEADGTATLSYKERGIEVGCCLKLLGLEPLSSAAALFLSSAPHGRGGRPAKALTSSQLQADASPQRAQQPQQDDSIGLARKVVPQSKATGLAKRMRR